MRTKCRRDIQPCPHHPQHSCSQSLWQYVYSTSQNTELYLLSTVYSRLVEDQTHVENMFIVNAKLAHNIISRSIRIPFSILPPLLLSLKRRQQGLDDFIASFLLKKEKLIVVISLSHKHLTSLISELFVALSDDQMRQRGATIDPHPKIESCVGPLHAGVKKKTKKRRLPCTPFFWMLAITVGVALFVLLSRHRKDPFLYKRVTTGSDSAMAGRRLKGNRTNHRHQKKVNYVVRNDDDKLLFL